MWRKRVSVTWVVGLDSNFFGGVFGLLTFFGESAAECEYAANFTDVKYVVPWTIVGYGNVCNNNCNGNVCNSIFNFFCLKKI